MFYFIRKCLEKGWNEGITSGRNKINKKLYLKLRHAGYSKREAQKLTGLTDEEVNKITKT